MPGAITNANTSYSSAIAIDTDSGTYVLGDKAANIEELRCPQGNFYLDRTTLNTAPTGWVTGLAYVHGAPAG